MTPDTRAAFVITHLSLFEITDKSPCTCYNDESSWSNTESTSTSCNLLLIPHLHVLCLINSNEPNTLALHVPANLSAKRYAKKRVQKS